MTELDAFEVPVSGPVTRKDAMGERPEGLLAVVEWFGAGEVAEARQALARAQARGHNALLAMHSDEIVWPV